MIFGNGSDYHCIFGVFSKQVKGIIRWFLIFDLQIPSMVLRKTSKLFDQLFCKAEIFDFEIDKSESSRSLYVEFRKSLKFQIQISQLWEIICSKKLFQAFSSKKVFLRTIRRYL